MKKIIDCFPYFNEKELLELRITLMKDHVEQIIICEGDRTFSGKPKPFTCKQTLDELGLMNDKITIVQVNFPDKKQEPDNWVRERLQRDVAAEYIDDDTIAHISDCDEIINPVHLKYFAMIVEQHPNNILRVPLVFLNGRADLQVYNSYNQPVEWAPSFFCMKHHCQKYSLSQIRESYAMKRNDIDFSDVFITENNQQLVAGWHFSWMGNSERMNIKCQSFSHADENVYNAVAPLNSIEMTKFIDQYIPKEGATDPLGRTNYVLKSYPQEQLPQELLFLPRVRDFLLPDHD